MKVGWYHKYRNEVLFMASREEILNTAKKIIYDNVPEMAGENLTEDTVLNTETAVDSMGFILIVTKLEGAFDVRIPDGEWNKMSTLGDVVDAIERHQKA